MHEKEDMEWHTSTLGGKTPLNIYAHETEEGGGGGSQMFYLSSTDFPEAKASILRSCCCD